MIFTLSGFQEHMIDDNYSPQACMRADPASVRPEDFKIARVRSPIGPENLLRYCADEAAGASLAKPSTPWPAPTSRRGWSRLAATRFRFSAAATIGRNNTASAP